MIDIKDAVLVHQYITGLKDLGENAVLVADVNGDGVINEDDVILILKKLTGLISEFPVEY